MGNDIGGVSGTNSSSNNIKLTNTTSTPNQVIASSEVADPAYMHRSQSQDYIKLSPEACRKFIKQMEPVATEFNKLDEKDFAGKAAVLEKHFQKMSLYSTNKAFKELTDQLIIDTRNGGFYDASRKLSDDLLRNKNASNILVGIFKSSYLAGFEKKPVLAALTYDRQDYEFILDRDAPSNAVALENTYGTQLWEFDGPDEKKAKKDRLNKVALFSEFWPSKEPAPADAVACYLMDRFAERTVKYIRPLMKYCIHSDSFSALRNCLNEKDKGISTLTKTSFMWPNNHEHKHGISWLPRNHRPENKIPQTPAAINNAKFGFDLAGTREGAAKEEGRADVEVLVDLFNSKFTANLYNVPLVRDLMLMERLVGYPMQKHPNKGFDSISSHMYMNFLFDQEAVYFVDGRLAIDQERIKEALKNFKDQFTNLESEISRTLDLSQPDDMKAAHNKLKHFVRSLACKHEEDDSPVWKKINKIGVAPKDGGFDYKTDYPMHPFYTYALSARTTADKEVWNVALKKLVDKNDFAVYGDQKPPVKSIEDLVNYLRDPKIDDRTLTSGDKFLRLLVSGDIEMIDSLDSKLIHLAGRSRDPGEDEDLNHIILEEIPKIMRKHGEDFPIKAVQGGRFLSRVKKVLAYKIDQCRVAAPSLTVGHDYVKDKSKDGEAVLEKWRRDRVMNNLKQRFKKPLLATTAALALATWFTAVPGKPPESNTRVASLEPKKGDQTITTVLHQSPLPSINNTSGQLASIKKVNGEWQIQYNKDENSEDLIGKFLRKLLPEILKSSNGRKLIKTANKDPESVTYVLLPPDSAITEVRVSGFVGGEKLNILIPHQLYNQVTQGQNIAPEAITINCPDFLPKQ